MATPTGLNRFVETFVGPLVMGGRVEVTGLLGPGVIRAWETDPTLDGSLVARITTALHARLARVGPVGALGTLPMDAVVLAAVWHNILAMTHPEARGRRGLRRRVRNWCLAMLEWVDAPRTRAEVTMRHGVLGRLGELGRVDTHVTFWAGYADFVGVAPPRALVALPTVRRVHEEKTRIDLVELLRGLEPASPDETDIDLHGVVRAALALSPLTDLALAERPAPVTFAWTPPTVNAAADAALRGAMQRGLLSRGTAAVRAVEQATLEAMRVQMPRKAALTLLRFHLEMLLLDALAARTPPAPSGGSAGTPGHGSHPGSHPGGHPGGHAGSHPGGPPGGTPMNVGGGGVSQPLALDAYVRLGYERTAALVGLPPELLARVLPLDPSRPLSKYPPSAPLLVCAGLLEVRT